MWKNVRIRWLVLLIVVVMALLFIPEKGIGEQDFLIYWSASRLLATGRNPYDLAALRTLEYATRPDRQQDKGLVFAAWNPPWLLLALLPFGLLPFDIAAQAWMLCNIGLIGAAVVLTWRLLVQVSDRWGFAFALVASLFFGPSLATLAIGQISSLLLIGWVLSAWWLQRGHDRLAGAALILAAIKPHVTYFFFLLLMLWVIRHRRWQVLVGLLAAGGVSAAILWLIFPGWPSAYAGLVGSHSFFQYSTSTVGGVAYALWGTNLLRFAGILVLPFIPFLLQLADTRGWFTAMNAALLISVPLAPYGFTFDQVVLVPAVVQIVTWLWYRELPVRWVWAIAAGLVAIYVAVFRLLVMPRSPYHWFAWTPLALGGLYALALRCSQGGAWRQRGTSGTDVTLQRGTRAGGA